MKRMYSNINSSTPKSPKWSIFLEIYNSILIKLK